MDNAQSYQIEKQNERRRKEMWRLSPDERLERFEALQAELFNAMSPEGLENFHRRNHRKRRVHTNSAGLQHA